MVPVPPGSAWAALQDNAACSAWRGALLHATYTRIQSSLGHVYFGSCSLLELDLRSLRAFVLHASPSAVC